MSDRYHSLTVVLEENTRDDDSQYLIDAICQMRNVLSVTGHVADFTSHMAEERAKRELGTKLFEIIYPKKP